MGETVSLDEVITACLTTAEKTMAALEGCTPEQRDRLYNGLYKLAYRARNIAIAARVARWNRSPDARNAAPQKQGGAA